MRAQLGWDVIYLIATPIIVIGPILALLKLADFIERYFLRCKSREIAMSWLSFGLGFAACAVVCFVGCVTWAYLAFGGS